MKDVCREIKHFYDSEWRVNKRLILGESKLCIWNNLITNDLHYIPNIYSISIILSSGFPNFFHSKIFLENQNASRYLKGAALRYQKICVIQRPGWTKAAQSWSKQIRQLIVVPRFITFEECDIIGWEGWFYWWSQEGEDYSL